MSAILVFAVCLCALSLALQASNDDCSHPPMQEVVPEKAHGYIRSAAAPSMYDCAAECKLSPLCLSFIFEPEKQTCQRLAEKRAKNHSSFTVGSGIFYSNILDWNMSLIGACGDASCGVNSRCTLGRNGQPLCETYDDIGENCIRDDDCLIMMTSCYYGRCLCHPGYSHNITSNSCDRVCKSYTNTMTQYEGLGIKNHNQKTVAVLGSLEDTGKTCMTACVNESSFVCKTADFSYFECYISSEGYLDVRPSERLQHLSKWRMAVRRCF